MNKNRSRTVRLAVAVLAAATMNALWAADGSVDPAGRQEAGKPIITITQVPNLPPGDGPMGDIGGRVSGASSAGCKVVVYAYGDLWYVQPWVVLPCTEIQKNGAWKTATHGGYEYAALLVNPSFRPAATAVSLPEVGGEILALAWMKPSKQ